MCAFPSSSSRFLPSGLLSTTCVRSRLWDGPGDRCAQGMDPERLRSKTMSPSEPSTQAVSRGDRLYHRMGAEAGSGEGVGGGG